MYLEWEVTLQSHFSVIAKLEVVQMKAEVIFNVLYFTVGCGLGYLHDVRRVVFV